MGSKEDALGEEKQIFFTNLQLLGFDVATMERKCKIPFNKDMFSLPNKVGAEQVLYFLFSRLDYTMCQQQFRDCWPVIDKKSEATFRRLCCIWLQNIQKEENEANLPRINASLFLSPGGDKFCHLLFAFSNYIIARIIQTEHGLKEGAPVKHPMLTPQNKELAPVMETTCKCVNIRHRKRFMGTLGQIAVAKQGWQTYADELSKVLRSLTKEVREFEREKRDLVQMAAQKGIARGSPIPPSRTSYNFDMSAHTASRAQRVQRVRGLWKGVETYVEKSEVEREIVSSIVDKTLQKYTIDAADIHISIPHLMLRECEAEIRRRQVDNIYEGGKLNLVSVLQLWNLALRLYIGRLNENGLKDLSDAANTMKGQAHTQQAFLANTTALREKMAGDLSQRKKHVERLRKQFHSEVKVSAMGMNAPSPPVTFDPLRGQSGSTPTGPVVQRTPDNVETPEAAETISEAVSRLSRKRLMEQFQATAFGDRGVTDLNWNNSSTNNATTASKIPQAWQQSTVSKAASKRPSRPPVSTTGKGSVQPRVIRHVGRQSANPSTSAVKKPADMASVKMRAQSARQPAASSHDRRAAAGPGSVDLHRTQAPSNQNNNTAEARQRRAQDILADKIVQVVMDGKDEDPLGLGLGFGLHSLLSLPTAATPTRPSASAAAASTSHPALTNPPGRLAGRDDPSALLTKGDFTTTPVRHSEAEGRVVHQDLAITPPPSLPSSVTKSDARSRDFGRSLVSTPPPPSPSSSSATRLKQQSRKDGSRGGRESVFGVVKSPVTLVQQAAMFDDDDDEATMAATDSRMVSFDREPMGSRRLGARTEADGGSPEAEDAPVPSPVASLSEEVLTKHDLFRSSPLARGIRRMWQDAISDVTDTDDGQRSKHSFDGEQLDGEQQEEENEETEAGMEGAEFLLSLEEEDTLLTSILNAEQNVAGWTERMSALYDEQDEVDEETPRADDQNQNRAFDSALDDIFQGKLPPSSLLWDTKDGVSSSGAVKSPESKSDASLISFTPSKSWDRGSGDLKASPERKAESPLISFTPQSTVEPVLSAQSPFSLMGESEGKGGVSGHEGWGNRKTSDDGVRSSLQYVSSPEEESSPKEPTAVPHTSNYSTRLSLSFSPGKHEDILDEEENLINISNTSLDESFTPARSGLFLQGKSPGRTKQQSVSLKSPGGNAGNSSLQDSVSSQKVSDDLRERCNHLKKMAADILGDTSRGNLFESDTVEDNTASAADSREPPSMKSPSQSFNNIFGSSYQLRPPENEKERKKKHAERNRLYRQRLKEDPVRLEIHKQKNRERSLSNYRRQCTAEEREHRCQLGRESSKRYREKKKAEKIANAAVCDPKPRARQTRRDAEQIRQQRKYWRERKQEQRKKWSSQKRRRHRESALAYYYKKKAGKSDEDDSILLPPSPE